MPTELNIYDVHFITCIELNVSDDIEEESYEFDYGNEPLPETNITFPTPSGITKGEAETHCRHRMNDASFFEVCRQLVLGDSIWDPLPNCIDDIRVRMKYSYLCLPHILCQCHIHSSINTCDVCL